ncbi:3'(2'),5'-bisphosphate nucleotidase [Trifolium repens]|nr:3'(2'),5'-bisphosphate nucleotidase [Trifolium repens]
MIGLISQSEEFSKELDVAVRAVQIVCSLCNKVQNNLILNPNSNSSVTVAGWSVKAIISWILCENISILAEEDVVQILSKPNATELLETVVKIVNECLAEAPQFGFEAPKSALETSEVLEMISHCNSIEGISGRFWTLGFVSGDQYAVALSLIEDGEVMVGVLGCPNYPMRKDWLSYQQNYHRIVSKLIPPTSETWNEGCVIYAKKGSGKAWIQPVIHVNKKFVWPNQAKQVSVSCIDNLGLATFCQSVEKFNSSHSFTDGLAHSIGLSNKPLRVYSMMKYAAIACGDAEVFMKFARTGCKEKVWDHAAGFIIIQEAGGTVTDVSGSSLDFSKGSYLQGIDRGIVACAGATLHEKIIDAVDASWASSCL